MLPRESSPGDRESTTSVDAVKILQHKHYGYNSLHF